MMDFAKPFNPHLKHLKFYSSTKAKELELYASACEPRKHINKRTVALMCAKLEMILKFRLKKSTFLFSKTCVKIRKYNLPLTY